MASMDDDADSAASNTDNDETMEDADEGEAGATGEVDAEAENEENEDNEEDEEEMNDNQDPDDESPTGPRAARAVEGGQRTADSLSRTDSMRQDQNDPPQGQTDGLNTKVDNAPGSSPHHGRAQVLHPLVRPETITAQVYDIVPTIAAPHSTSINTVTATPCMRWVFSGGTDGWIRKFNWLDTANAKAALTVAQRHPFVDSVTKAGVLMSYWENEEPSDQATATQQSNEALLLSPVHSLAVHDEALWLLSGTESGPINLQSVRHEEGKRITSLFKHESAVSVLSLSNDQTSVLSGSWDKSIFDWDLNTGQSRREFVKSSSQISALEMRPISNVPVPRDTLQAVQPSDTFSSNGTSKNLQDSLTNGIPPSDHNGELPNGTGSPADSLFGGNDHDSLFGDNDGNSMPGMGFNDDANDELAKALNEGLKEVDNANTNGDRFLNGDNQTSASEQPESGATQDDADEQNTEELQKHLSAINGDQSSSETEEKPHTEPANDFNFSEHFDVSENTFLDASIDGSLRVWDRRRPNPVARMTPSRSVPPWCMHASWAPDGNSIYAGRRNGTVDVYDVHKGLREPVRSLKFPAGSGPVSAVRAMPNNKHIVCASYDILRLYDLTDLESAKHSRVPFLIVPGHRTGTVSHLYLDPTCTFMISTGGTRGWESASTEVLLGYEIGIGR